jgi:parallel beta-helix repeat protein
LNVENGNGSALSALAPPLSDTSNNFGIGLVGTSKNNVIEKNKIGGNLNGVYIAFSTQGGNVIRRNVIAGNPAVQVSLTFGSHVGADIQDLSPSAANSFEQNYCITYSAPLRSGVEASVEVPCPNLRTHASKHPEQREAEQGR